MSAGRPLEGAKGKRSRTPHKDAPWRVGVQLPSGRSRGAELFAEKGPRVFERSEFARTPRKASTAGCP